MQALLLAAASRAVADKDDERSAEHAYLLAKIGLLGDRIEEGIEHLERAVRAKPLRHAWRAELAEALLATDRLAEAVRHAQVCVHQRPSSGAYRQLLRRVQQQIRRAPRSAAPSARSPGLDLVPVPSPQRPR